MKGKGTQAFPSACNSQEQLFYVGCNDVIPDDGPEREEEKQDQKSHNFQGRCTGESKLSSSSLWHQFNVKRNSQFRVASRRKLYLVQMPQW